MAIPIVSFLSYNSTGFNSIKAKWMRDLCSVSNVDFFSLQEHFKSSKNADQHFRDQFPDYFSYVLPAARAENQDRGRPSGGLAQFRKKSLNIKSELVKTSNMRVQAQIIVFPASRIMWINTYLPNDPQTQEFDDNELLSVLTEIENILDNHEFDDCIWQGDLNWDPRRLSGFSFTLRQFLERIGLVSVWDHHPIDFTHVHTDLISTSILDHFVVNKRLLSLIKDANVLHLGDNLSRHCPIMLKINLGGVPVKRKIESKRPRRPMWYKANEFEIFQYTYELEKRLASLELPQSIHCHDPHCQIVNHSSDRDSFVLDVMSSVIETSHEYIPVSGGTKSKVTPSCPIQKTIPGWNDEVAPYKDDARFWYAVWQSAGRPSQGQLKEIMKSNRNKYHYAVRRVQKMSNSIRAKKLLEASYSDSKTFFKEMRQVKDGRKAVDMLPDNIEDSYGEQNIANKFRGVYSALYSSADTSEETAYLKDSLTEEINYESLKEVFRINGNTVKNAACKMKHGKTDVTGSYSSDSILNSPDIFFDLMALVFQSWLIHGTVTPGFLSCAFLPLFKGGLKDPSSTDSYRAIAGSSLILKLFDNVVIYLWGDLLSTDSLQFGFKSGTSTTECTWLVMEVANYFIRKGSPCLVSLLDCTKAFDTCKFNILFKKLRDKNLPAILIRALIFIYQEQVAWVNWGCSKSKQFKIVNGTRQGSVLSPYFFAIYIDELLIELRNSGAGCHIGQVFFGAMGYADDIILLAPSRGSMEKMLNICEEFGFKNNLKFSTDVNPSKSKTKCMYMCGPNVKSPKYPVPLKLYGKDLPWVRHANHLGHEISEDGSMNLDTNIKRADFIRKSSELRDLFSFALPLQVLGAVTVYSCHFYGSMLWDLFGENAGKVYRSWNTCVKLVWNVPRNTHNYFVENLLAKSFYSVRAQIL